MKRVKIFDSIMQCFLSVTHSLKIKIKKVSVSVMKYYKELIHRPMLPSSPAKINFSHPSFVFLVTISLPENFCPSLSIDTVGQGSIFSWSVRRSHNFLDREDVPGEFRTFLLNLPRNLLRGNDHSVLDISGAARVLHV